jgi:hypothetical protein
MSESPLLACVIAVELDPAFEPARRALTPGDAGQLAAHVMADLAGRLPDIGRCGLSLAGALYDMTEILRPDWRVFRALHAYYRRGAGVLPQLMALGAAEGRMSSDALEPDPNRNGAPLVYLPFVLMAPEDIAVELGEALEELLVASGQLAAASALGVQSLFGMRLKHAQFLTRYDLCALMAAQLEPLGLAPLWSLLETALLTPDGAQRAEDGQGGTWYWRRHRVESGFTGHADWLASAAGQKALAEGRVAQGFADALLAQRQYLTLLLAHGVPVNWPGGHCASMIEVLAPGKPECVHAVRLPGLGLAARIAVRGDTIVAIGYPFSTDGLGEIATAVEHVVDGDDLRAWPVDAASGRLRLPRTP